MARDGAGRLPPDERVRVHAEILRLYAEGRLWREIAASTGVSLGTVGAVLRGHTTNRYNRGTGLTDDDRAAIERLAARGLGPGAVAARIGRSHHTVRWYMCSRGLAVFGTMPSFGGGRPFGPEEDAYIVALRLDGLSHDRIARLVRDRFGWQRGRTSIRYRLTMLATQEAA